MRERYYQITIVAVDTMPEDGKLGLTSEAIEQSFRRANLPQCLALKDVEVMEVGNNFHINPTPEDLQDHRESKLRSIRVSQAMSPDNKDKKNS